MAEKKKKKEKTGEKNLKKTGKKDKKAGQKPKKPKDKMQSFKAKEELRKFEEKKLVAPAKEKKRFEFRQIPVYLWVLFLVLGIAGGAALSVLLQPGPQPIVVLPPNSIEPDGPMEIELIYSNDCSFCIKHNTIFDTFTVNKIDFKVKEIEASTQEGIEKIAIFEPEILPAALVPAKGLNKFLEIKQAMEHSFKKVNGFFVVPELNLDSSKLYSRMYLETIDATDCNATDPKSDVILFDDPYNEIMIKTQPVLNNVLTKFKDFTRVKFEFIPSNVNTLKQGADPEITKLTANYLVCSSAQNLFIEGYNRTLSTYCGGTDLKITTKDIKFCEISPHYGTPLSLKEIEAATIEMKRIEPNPFDACLGFTDELNKSSIKRAQQYSITRTGTAIVDCRFSVPYQAIGLAICESNPEIEPCKKK